MVNILPLMGIHNNFGVPNQVIQKNKRNIKKSTSQESIAKDFPWVVDKNVLMALNELKQVHFNKQDILQLSKMGVRIPFDSGFDAVQFLKNANVRIIFDKMDKEIHAQYDYQKNFIKINSIYKNTSNTAEILAMAEAILHEAGHAKDEDDNSSLQEEINFLGLNVLAHRYFKRKYPVVFDFSESLIVKDGVSVYEKLFFDEDINKSALIKRLQNKYGYLPAGDIKHPPTSMAFKVKGL